MILDLMKLQDDIEQLTQQCEKETSTPIVPPVKKQIEEEVDGNNVLRQKEDTQFIKKCYQYLKKLGYIKTQYEFSTECLKKCKYYYGMLLCEERHPSVDSVYNLIHTISNINDGHIKVKYLDNLYEEGQSIITKRLLKFI